MKQCDKTIQFKHKELRCEFPAGHAGMHFNEEFGCWPALRQNMDEMVNRYVLFGVLILIAVAFLGLILWLIKYHP